MKTIVISGAHSHIGKTTLARAIRDVLPGAVYVKIGTGAKKENSLDILYPFGTAFGDIRARHGEASFLLIESNHILAELDPDLCIFLGGRDEKPSAALARQKADLIRGCKATEEKVAALAGKLGITQAKMHEICFLAGANPEPVSAIIMAGGASSRMGKNKAFLPIDGKPMIRHIHDTLLQFCDEVIISASKTQDPPISDAHIVVDLKPDQGPLMGIYSSLHASSSRVNFVVACDIPTIHLPLVRRLLSWSPRYDIIVPSFKPQEYEPLFAVYTKGAVTAARTLLDNGQRRISGLFPLCKTKVLEISECGWYVNLNTPEDYHSFIQETRERDKQDE